MNVRLWVIIAWTVCLLVGCRRDPSVYIEVLNAQKRALEDELYELEYDYELALDELEHCRAQLQEQTDGLELTPARRSPLTPPRTPSIPDLGPPVIEEGVPLPSSEIDIDTGADVEELESTEPTEAASPVETLPDGTSADQTDPAHPGAPRLVIDPLQTGGTDLDDQPGDDGLVVVVRREGGDAQQPNEDPQRIAVALLDPAEEGEKARVARWDITAQQIANYRQQSARGPSYRLKLPWPDRQPAHSQLRLFVRYVGSDGNQLEADQDINIALPGQAVSSWTPRSADTEAAANVARRQEEYGQTRLGIPQPVHEPQESALRYPAATPTPTAPALPPRRPQWNPNR